MVLSASAAKLQARILNARQLRRWSRGRMQLSASSLFILMLAGSAMRGANAQKAPAAVPGHQRLPDAPEVEGQTGSPGQASVDPRAAGTITGTVFDANGDVLQGARVLLTAKSSPEERVQQSGSNGEFSFEALPAGTYKVTVSGPGMETFVSPEIALATGETHSVARIVLAVASATTEVRVTADSQELSEEQVHIAVEQRVLGVLPNFYTTFDWNAPPMESKQKFQLAFRSVTDPVAFLGAGVLAGIQQANNSYPGYGQEELGYSKRFGAAYTNDVTGRMLSSAILPTLFHQDPRYFYRGTGSKTTRALYAIAAAVVARGDNGRWQPNYSHVLGSFGAGAISNLYYPPASRGLSLTLVNGLIETAGNAGNNLLREFVLKGLTKNVPSYANGKP